MPANCFTFVRTASDGSGAAGVAMTFDPTALQQVNDFGLGDPMLVGLESMIDEANQSLTNDHRFNITNGNWDVADELEFPWSGVQNPTTGAASGNWLPTPSQNVPMRTGKQLAPVESDWTVTAFTSGTIRCAVGMHLSYPDPEGHHGVSGWPLGHLVSRRTDKGANLTATTWTEMGTITDFNTDFDYYLVGLGILGDATDTDVEAMRVSWPGRPKHCLPGCIGSQRPMGDNLDWFADAQGPVNGKKTVTIEGFGAAKQPIAMTYWIKVPRDVAPIVLPAAQPTIPGFPPELLGGMMAGQQPGMFNI